MYEKFADPVENIDDYIVVKKHDYVMEKDGKQTFTAIYSKLKCQIIKNLTAYILFKIQN